MSQISPDLYTDRQHLTTAAYGDSANLMARVQIYDYQQPPIDLAGWALAQVPWRGDEQVVDVGCGPGLYLRRLAERQGLRLIGVDLSRGMLADLERGWDVRLPKPRLLVADAQALPLPGASCDVALAMHMLYHVPDMARAARELRRVLRPGGVLLAVTNAEDHTRELHDVYNVALSRIAGQPAAQPKFSHRFTLENGADLLRTAFQEVERRDVMSMLVVPEAEPVLCYFASTRATREPALPHDVTWDVITSVVERLVVERIAEDGAFHIRTHTGVFVCR